MISLAVFVCLGVGIEFVLLGLLCFDCECFCLVYVGLVLVLFVCVVGYAAWVCLFCFSAFGLYGGFNSVGFIFCFGYMLRF